MNIKKVVSKKWIENYLGTDKKYLSDEFWESDASQDVFFEDASLKTVKKEISLYMKLLKIHDISDLSADELFEIFHVVGPYIDSYVAVYVNKYNQVK